MNNSQSSNRLPALLLLAVAVFGPPSVAALAFAHAITSNPWLTAGLIAIYEIIVMIIAFISKIWQRLEEPWIEQAAQWLDIRVKELLSRYRQRYCQFIIYLHRDLDMKGLSTQGTYTLKLEHVFVNLNIIPMPAHQISADPLNEPAYSKKQGVSIWDHLNSKALKGQNFAIIGSPGSGKTTLLKHMALTLASHKRSINHLRLPRKLPILLFLRDHIDTLKDKSGFSLADAIYNHLANWEQTIPHEWVKQQLEKGYCLVLLDGLDEVADPLMRRRMVEWVQRNMVTYGKNRFIVTSRPYGYRDNPLNGVAVLEVNLFTRKQIELFVHNWYLANELMAAAGKDDPGVHMNARAGANDLLQRMYNKPVLLQLAVNPLLLTMITTVHRYRGTLPGKRVALYDEICEVFLGKRQEARGLILELTAAQKQKVLQPLAYYMMENGIRKINSLKAEGVIKESLANVSIEMSSKQFLSITENTSGILLEREQGIYAFAHLTFQEYLAATYIKEQKLVHLLPTKVEIGWWNETIRLYCAQADATPLVEACLNNTSLSITSLTLAMECAEEALTLKPMTRTSLNTLIDQGIEATNKQRQHIVLNAVLSQRIRQMIYLDTGIYVDLSLITQAEYHFFLDHLPSPKSCYPDHWLGMRAIIGKGYGRTPMLGVRPSDAQRFCDWLTKQDGVWQFRLPKSGELEKIAANKAIADKLTNGTGYWTNGGRDFVWAKDAIHTSKHIVKMLFSRNRVYSIVSDLAEDIIQLQPTSDKDNETFINRIFHSYSSQGYTLQISSAPILINRINSVFDPTSTHDYVLDLATNLAYDHMSYLGNSLNLDPFLNYGKNFFKTKEQYLNTMFDYIKFFRAPLPRVSQTNRVSFGKWGGRIQSWIPDDKWYADFNTLREFQERIFLFSNDICNALSDVEKRNYSGINIQFLYRTIRFCTLALSHQLLNLKEFTSSFDKTGITIEERQLAGKSAEEMRERLLSNLLKIYVAFTFAEARIMGQYPPCEGILIIKEYKK